MAAVERAQCAQRMVLKKLLKLAAAAVFILVVGSVLAMNLRPASHDRDWKPEYARLPKATIDGDRVTIEELRDFSYGPEGAIQEQRFGAASYRLSEINSAWYGISHFASYGLAHTFLSFGFSDGRYLAISIEARQTVDQSYNPLLGLFGAYELIVVAGTERDIIGLRSHVRQERVYLYPIDAPKSAVERLFREMIGRIEEIRESAEHYHTITDNCTVAIWRYAEKVSAFERYTNPKLLLPGFSDEVAFDLGLIAGSGTIEALRRAAYVDPRRAGLDEPEFSKKIRAKRAEW